MILSSLVNHNLAHCPVCLPDMILALTMIKDARIFCIRDARLQGSPCSLSFGAYASLYTFPKIACESPIMLKKISRCSSFTSVNNTALYCM
jgi:hypothetical protein